MVFSIQGKVALVTGGASGFGYHVIENLLKQGLKGVTIVDLDEIKGESAKCQFNREFGAGTCIFKQTNVADAEELKDAFDLTVNTFKQLDIVINNAAVISEIDWKKCIDVNLSGYVAVTKLAIDTYLPKYKSGVDGIIINIASIAGLEPIGVTPIYTSTKFGVLGLTRAYGLKEHYEATNIKIMAVCPGYMKTPMVLEPNSNAYNLDYSKRFQSGYSTEEFPLQDPAVPAENLMEIIKIGENGSVWVIEDSQPGYEIEFHHRFHMKKIRNV